MGCQLALSDAAPAPVVQIPLSVEARPEQIREAAVRVAWFISTSAPKARPEQPVDAVASVESPLPKPSEEEDPFAVSDPDALGAEPGSELPEFPVSKKPDVSELPEFPSARTGAEVAVSPSPVSMRSDEVALTLREPGHPSVLRSLSSTLAGWRDTSPELFGTLEELGTDPPPAYVMGKPVPLGGYVSGRFIRPRAQTHADDTVFNLFVDPKGNANFAWLQHMIARLSGRGRAGIVLANGSMSSQQSGEGDIRRNMVQADIVEAMVALPGQLFSNTQIPACLWFLSKDKGAGTNGQQDRKGQILFIDARKVATGRISRTQTARPSRRLRACSSSARPCQSADGAKAALPESAPR